MDLWNNATPAKARGNAEFGLEPGNTVLPDYNPRLQLASKQRDRRGLSLECWLELRNAASPLSVVCQ